MGIRIGIVGIGWVGSSVAISLPAVVGRDGAVQVVEPQMTREERKALERSAGVLQQARATLDAG